MAIFLIIRSSIALKASSNFDSTQIKNNADQFRNQFNPNSLLLEFRNGSKTRIENKLLENRPEMMKDLESKLVNNKLKLGNQQTKLDNSNKQTNSSANPNDRIDKLEKSEEKWSDWSECSVDCGIGIQTQRLINEADLFTSIKYKICKKQVKYRFKRN